MALWYFQSGGSDFRAYLSAFYPHLSPDVSCDFTSGSSVFFSALRSVASSVPLPPSSLPPPASSAALAFPQPPAPSPPAPSFPPPSSVPPTPSLGSFLAALGWGASALGSSVGVSSAPPGFPLLLAPSSLFSVHTAPSSSLAPAAPLLAPPSSSSSSWGTSVSGVAAAGVGAAPAVPVIAPLAPDPQPSLFRPFAVPEPASVSLASVSAPLGSAPFGSAAGPSGFASTASGSASGPSGFAPAPGPSLAVPLRSGASAGPSAPPPSTFAYPPDDPFAPGFADPEAPGSAVPDPEAPLPPSVQESVRSEVRRMYQYLVDLFPQAAGSSQAPPPPRSLFEDFFAPPSSPHQPVYLAWFERVRSTLSEADSRIAVLLVSGHPEASLLPPRSAQCSVGGDHALGSAAPVNPSLLAMFERPLRPSLHLGLMIQEAALLEASSRALSESLSHAMWLLSGLLGFLHLQGFSPSFSPLFNTLVMSLKCLALQASISASHTAFVGLKRCQFYLSHLPAYFSDIHKHVMLAAPLVCADSLFAESDISRLLSDTQTLSSLRSQQALVDVASNRSGAQRHRFSPARSPPRSSPSRRRCRESGSSSRSSKSVRFDSPAPSALKPSRGFRR